VGKGPKVPPPELAGRSAGGGREIPQTAPAPTFEAAGLVFCRRVEYHARLGPAPKHSGSTLVEGIGCKLDGRQTGKLGRTKLGLVEINWQPQSDLWHPRVPKDASFQAQPRAARRAPGPRNVLRSVVVFYARALAPRHPLARARREIIRVPDPARCS